MIQPFISDEFATPGSEYEPGPVPPPLVPPDFRPVDVPISCLWLPYVAGACKAMLQEATWKTTDQAQLEQVLNQVQQLLLIFAQAGQNVACNSNQAPFACPFDFSLTNGGFMLANFGPSWSPGTAGSYLAGAGWLSTNNNCPTCPASFQGVVIEQTFVTVPILTALSVQFDWHSGTFTPSPEDAVVLQAIRSGSVVASLHVPNTALVDGTNVQVLHIPSLAVDTITIAIASGVTDGPFPGGNLILENAEMDGVGTPPC